MASKATVELTAGPLRLELNPLIGGSISAFEWTDPAGPRRILRDCNSRAQNVLEAASFPLVPYVNRIRGGRFEFRGREVRLAPNMAGDPSPLHGQGWLHAWDVESASDDAALLTYRHEAGEWPWSYTAWQEFRLEEAALAVRLTCRNGSEEPMPCGLGLHPYFNCGPETRISTHVTDAWTVDANVLPVDKVPAEGRYGLWDRPICGQGLDNGFGGWTGRTLIEDPSWPFDIHMDSPDARFFQVYSPPAGGIFVAEPVTHANAALNEPESEWRELGMRVLEPGEAMHLDMRLEVRAK